MSPGGGRQNGPVDMDSAGGNSGKLFDEMPAGLSEQGSPRSPSPAAMDPGFHRSGVMLGEMPQMRSRLAFHAGVSLRAGLPPDILGVVLRFLSCLADRARVRSVCRHLRACERGHVLPPPMPLLVLPDFKFSSLSDKGDLVACPGA